MILKMLLNFNRFDDFEDDAGISMILRTMLNFLIFDGFEDDAGF